MRKLFIFLMALCVFLQVAVVANAASGKLDMQVVAPESVGMSSARLDRIQAAWEREIEKKSFAGAVTLIARDGKVVYYKTVGHLDAKQTKPMPFDAVFNIASMTKPVVSIATMMLAEQGILKISDPISKYLPEFVDKEMKVEVVKEDAEGKIVSELVPAERAITIQDLLRHTSGFTYSDRVSGPLVKKAYADANIEARAVPLSGKEMIERLAKAPLVCQPGTLFNYSISTDVLGLLLERVLNKKLDAILNEMVLEPLGMTETSFTFTPERKARQAEFLDTEPNKDGLIRAIEQSASADGTTSFFGGGGGLISTTSDYFPFLTMLLNGGELNGVRLISPVTLALMTTDHLTGTGSSFLNNIGTGSSIFDNAGTGYGFGLGFAVRTNKDGSWGPGSIGDYNWGGARGTFFIVDPEEKIIGIFMSYGAAVRLHVRQIFRSLLYAAIEKEYVK